MAVRLQRSYLQALEHDDENQVLHDLARAPRLELVHSEPIVTVPVEAPPAKPGLDWMARGACRNLPPQWWFSDAKDTRSRDADVTKGKQVCAECPVREDCLEYSLVNREEHGTWGGVGPRERGRMLRARR